MNREKVLTLSRNVKTLSPDEVARAVAEENMVKKVLREVCNRRPAQMTTPKSIRDGEKLIAEMNRVSTAKLLSRIERGEVVTRDELVARLGGNRRWVKDSLRSGRLFSIRAPSGVEYFAEFFVNALYDRRSLGRVVRVLAGLPGPSIYHFFVSKSVMLGMTPLEALAEGRIAFVLDAAHGFTER